MQDVTREALSRHTTLRLGGPAGRLVVPVDMDELVQTVRGTDDLLLLGGGSNVVISDAGWPGTVVLIRTQGHTVTPVDADRVDLTVAAGQPWDEVVQIALGAGLSGLECLSGIPGSAGATPIQNVGAYGQEVSHTIVGVRVFDRTADRVRDLTAAECGFAYRSSRFKHSDRYLVLGVTFRLVRSGLSGPVGYGELARALGIEVGGRAPVAAVRAAVLDLRAGKGMVLDPTDPDTRSVGSFFVNPVLPADRFAALRDRAIDVAGTAPAAWPGGPADPGAVKVSAAWLIERAGFHRGYTGGQPGVGVSGKHSLALTNRGTGTTDALLDLAREIRDGVAKVFEVELHPEPVLVNCAL